MTAKFTGVVIDTPPDVLVKVGNFLLRKVSEDKISVFKFPPNVNLDNVNVDELEHCVTYSNFQHYQR